MANRWRKCKLIERSRLKTFGAELCGVCGMLAQYIKRGERGLHVFL